MSIVTLSAPLGSGMTMVASWQEFQLKAYMRLRGLCIKPSEDYPARKFWDYIHFTESDFFNMGRASHGRTKTTGAYLINKWLSEMERDYGSNDKKGIRKGILAIKKYSPSDCDIYYEGRRIGK